MAAEARRQTTSVKVQENPLPCKKRFTNASKFESITVAGCCTSSLQRRWCYDAALRERIRKAKMKKNQGKPYVECSASEKQIASSPFNYDDCPFAPAKGKLRSRLDSVPSKLVLNKKNVWKEFQCALDEAERIWKAEMKKNQGRPHVACSASEQQTASSPFPSYDCPFAPAKGKFRSRLDAVPSKHVLDKQNVWTEFEHALDKAELKGFESWKSFHDAPHSVRHIKNRNRQRREKFRRILHLSKTMSRHLNRKCINRLDGGAVSSFLCRNLNFDDDVSSTLNPDMLREEESGMDMKAEMDMDFQCSLEEASPEFFMKCVTVDSPPAFRRIKKALPKTKSSSYSLCLQISFDFGDQSYLLSPFYKKQGEAQLRKNTGGIRGLFPPKIVRKQKSTLLYMR